MLRITALQLRLLMLYRVAIDSAAGPEAHAEVARVVDGYWRAQNADWSHTRAGCMRLLEALDGVEDHAALLRMIAVFVRERRHRIAPADPRWAPRGQDEVVLAAVRDDLRAQLDAYLGVLEEQGGLTGDLPDLLAAREDFNEVEAVRLFFQLEFYAEGQLLSDEDIERALAVWRRGPGGRRTTKDDKKWPFLVALCERLFGQRVAADLDAVWRDWRSARESKPLK